MKHDCVGSNDIVPTEVQVQILISHSISRAMSEKVWPCALLAKQNAGQTGIFLFLRQIDSLLTRKFL